jgi:fibronectin type 3 domain-containing protein
MRVRIALAILIIGALVMGGAIIWLLRGGPVVAPSNEGLTAQPGDTVVNLTWQPASGARGYFIYRDNSATPLNPTPITDTRFQDIGLTNGRTYTYDIAAVNQDGQTGPRSTPITATPKSR